MSLKFSTLEYAHFERGNDWYWILGIATITVLVVSIIFGNTLFGIVLTISAFSLTLYTSRKPKEITVEVSNDGIKIDKTLFPYETLRSFCITKGSHHEHLRLRSSKKLMPTISVIVSGISKESLFEEISKYIPEEYSEPSTSEKIMEALGL